MGLLERQQGTAERGSSGLDLNGEHAMRHFLPERRDLQPQAIWTFTDVSAVSLIVFGGTIIIYIVGYGLAGDTRIPVVVGLYSGGLLGLCVPILWIRTRYGYTKAALGLRRGNLRSLTSVAIGGAVALAYYLLVRLVLFPHPTPLSTRPSYLALVLVPLSISGFSSVILGPISEEVLVRGFLYGYLRKLLGIGPGLVLQALLFSALHLGSSSHSSLHTAIDAFLIGSMLGILYEKTGSLFAPIICHSTVNYLAVLRTAL